MCCVVIKNVGNAANGVEYELFIGLYCPAIHCFAHLPNERRNHFWHRPESFQSNGFFCGEVSKKLDYFSKGVLEMASREFLVFDVLDILLFFRLVLIAVFLQVEQA